jgi:lipoate-protein ligase A
MGGRFIDTGLNSGSMNMAIDEALLSSKKPVLRLYQWKPACLSLGTFQKIDAIDIDFCRRKGIDIVRRVTGGTAVLHDKELTYSFIIDEDKMPSSIIESYKKISKGIIRALGSIGLRAVMNEDVGEGERSAVCFHDPTWYEIIVNGKKVVGSAQRRINGKLLQHGAILLDADVDRYLGCFNNKNLPGSLRNRMSSLNAEAGKKINVERLKAALKKGFEKALGIEFERSGLSGSERETAEGLNKGKYSRHGWNVR